MNWKNKILLRKFDPSKKTSLETKMNRSDTYNYSHLSMIVSVVGVRYSRRENT